MCDEAMEDANEECMEWAREGQHGAARDAHVDANAMRAGQHGGEREEWR